jgi:two-component system response regulator (stage 0 sporulation protein A)
MIERAMNVGAKYFMAKPFNFDVLRDRILELDETLAQKQNGVANRNYPSLDERISNIFINVGIPPHIKGYSFLREGVKMAVENPSIINNITKKLYPMIGEKYQTTASKVERAIRHAIEVAWNRGRIESINNILGVRAISKAEKPTNGEFIALVADKMLLERA